MQNMRLVTTKRRCSMNSTILDVLFTLSDYEQCIVPGFNKKVVCTHGQFRNISFDGTLQIYESKCSMILSNSIGFWS